MNYYKILIYMIIALIASSCSITHKKIVDQSNYISHSDARWLKHIESLKQIRQYTAEGRIGYVTNKQSASVNFNLSYKDKTKYTLDITSNFSNKSLHLAAYDKKFIVTNEDAGSKEYLSVDEAMQDILSVSFPVDQLLTWIKGQIEPNYNDYYVNQQALLDNFNYIDNTNKQWNVKFNKYEPQGDLLLPQNILVSSKDTKLKVIIKTWNIKYK